MNNFISIFDFTKEQIEEIFCISDEYEKKLDKGEKINICDDKILISLFYEPSTRTRLSFEVAMYKLGGKVLSIQDVLRDSSVAKGETIADTIRVLENYADIIIMRHTKEGAVKLAAEYAKKAAIINAGDGANEHPTQTLCDLYTIKKEKGKIEGINVALCGDLKHSRTIHSLIYGLALLGANINLVSPPSLTIQEEFINNIRNKYNSQINIYTSLDEMVTLDKINTNKGSQSMLFDKVISLFDVIYLTRLQKERFKDIGEFEALRGSYLLNKALLKWAKKDTIIMHPLPRTDELEYEIDKDKRAAYFREIKYSIPIRMALISVLLGSKKLKSYKKKPLKLPIIKSEQRCINLNCITHHEKYVSSKFIIDNQRKYCFYCNYLFSNT